MARITIEEAKRLWIIKPEEEKIKRQKFKNKIQDLWGILFQSNLEKKRHEFLVLCKRIGKIKDFVFQPEKFLLENGTKFKWKKLTSISYTPDFLIITNDNKKIYEDTKSIATFKTSTYRMKRKMFIKKYIEWKEDVDFVETFEYNKIVF